MNNVNVELPARFVSISLKHRLYSTEDLDYEFIVD